MNISQIIELLNNNKESSKWGHVSEGNEDISYCLENVNLRMTTRIDWEKGKPIFAIRMFYNATELLHVPLPLTSVNLSGSQDQLHFELMNVICNKFTATD